MPYANPEDRRAFARRNHLRLKNDPHYKEVRKRARLNYLKSHPEKANEWKRNFYRKHPEKKLEYQRIANKNRRLKTIELLGGKCNKCGITDFRVLQVDHINADGAEERRKYGQSVLKAKILAQLKDNPEQAKKKYQLLCANCNWIKIWENKEYN